MTAPFRMISINGVAHEAKTQTVHERSSTKQSGKCRSRRQLVAEELQSNLNVRKRDEICSGLYKNFVNHGDIYTSTA